jgi:RNA polymerase sigma-70 factor (ECF subfamily)
VKRAGTGEAADPEGRGGEVQKPGFATEALPWMDAVYRFAVRLSRGNEADAEDLVQSTFLRAYRSWHTFTPGTSARSWLFTICRNQYLRGEERRGRRPEVNASEVDAEVESLAATAVFSEVESANPEKSFFDSFVDDEVLRALDQLGATYREAIILSDLEGLSYPEVGEVLGVPVGTVKSRLFRGRRLLQQSLYEYALEMGYIRPKNRQ